MLACVLDVSLFLTCRGVFVGDKFCSLLSAGAGGEDGKRISSWFGFFRRANVADMELDRDVIPTLGSLQRSWSGMAGDSEVHMSNG